MKRNWKSFFAGVLAAATCVSALPAAPALAEETELGMGRYLESEVALPDGVSARDVEKLEDGSLALIGETEEGGTSVYTSTDGGEVWEQSYVLPQGYAGLYLAAVQLSPKGGGAAILLEETDDPSQMNYTFLSFDASGNAQATPLENEFWLLEFTPGGELLGMSYNNGVSCLDTATGAVSREISSGAAAMIGVCGDEALLLTEGEVQRYDIATGEPLSRDDVLNEALYADGTSYMMMSASGYQIVFAQDEENRLYYCTNKGIFSHMMDGSVVEQIVDGTLTTLSLPNLLFRSLVAADQTFYVLCTEDGVNMRLLKYEYAPDVSSTPEKELTVYSLTENDIVRQAIVTFQKKYPDTYVNYRVGMSGEDGVTAADAMRTLNTDILAGNGPDVLVLDGMSVDTYASQGVLMDLTDVIAEVRDSEGLLENIADAYRTEDMLPAVPARFGIEMAAGDPELLSGLSGLTSLEEIAAQQGALNPFDIVNLPELLYPVCAGSWKKDDQTIDQEKLAEFVNGVKNISDVYRASASPETLEDLTMYEDGTYAMWSDLSDIEQNSLVYGILDLLAGTTKVKLGTLGSIIDYSGLVSVNGQTGTCAVKTLSMQQSGVFYPSGILSVLNTAKEQERACDFVVHLLSAESQNGNASGFPVNRTSFDKLLSEDQYGEDGGYSMSSSDEEGNMVDLQYVWPTEEEMDTLREIVESLSVCADTERVQRDTVIEEVKRCISGEISADEAVNSIMQKLNLYLAE